MSLDANALSIDWLVELRKQCQRTSQKRVSKVLGYSSGTISQVLKNKYPGNMEKFELAVRGAYMGITVDCPIYGEIESNRCLSYQRQPWASTNPNRVKLYKACRSGCPHSQLEQVKK